MAGCKHFNCLTNLNHFIKDYEEQSKSTFIVLKSDRAFGKSDFIAEKKIQWEVKNVPFNGVPFMVVGKKVFICHQGRDKHAKDKRRREEQTGACHTQDHSYPERRRLVPTKTKKRGCPATIDVVHIVRFPTYKIAEDNPCSRRKASSTLKEALSEEPSRVHTEEIFAAYFPVTEEHHNHRIVGEAAEVREPVDDRVEKHIETLTLAGARKVDEVRRHLTAFVRDELFGGMDPPPPTERKYFPLGKDILSIMQRVKRGNRKSSVDQLNLQGLVDSWRQEDCTILYRPSQQEEDGAVSKLLVCLQTAWQKRLLLLYGQQMCLLDATYRTSRYSVPLFFLYVRTNVNYAVVGVFITQEETREDIKEALGVFKEWNSDWNPSHFMVDFCEAEIGALEEVFKDSEVLLCDFHREKAWVEWTRRKSNGVTCQEEVLKLLRAVADSRTEAEFENNTLTLQQDPAWQTNKKLRRWFSNKWLPEAERWVNAFKNENLRVAVYSNNGVERQNETLKHSYLKGYKNGSLSDTLTMITSDILPRSYQKYIELNANYSSEHHKYSGNMPCYLRDGPRLVTQHIMARHQESLVFEKHDIESAGEAVFSVLCRASQQRHQVDFGSDEHMPSCTCMDWQGSLLPCKHFCAVFNLVPGWSWENLSSAFRGNPLFTVDEACLSSTAFVVTSPADPYLVWEEREAPSSDDDGRYEEVGSPQGDARSPIAEADIPPQTDIGLPSNATCAAHMDSAPGNARGTTRKRQKCGSLIREISNRTHHLQDEHFMDSLIGRLTDLLEDVRRHSPHDYTLPLSDSPPSKKTRWVKRTIQKKQPVSQRAGRRAEITRAANLKGAE